MAARRPQPPPPPPPPPPQQQQKPRRPRGILAFLPATGEHYPHLDDYWKKTHQSGTDGGGERFENSSRTTRKRRRSRRPPPGSETVLEDGQASETVSLVDWFHGRDDDDESSEQALASTNWTLDASKDAGAKESAPERLLASPQGDNLTTILVLFCFDPDQPYSGAVRNRILGLFDGLARGQRSSTQELRLRCVAISGAHRTSPGGAAATADFLRHTGFVSVPWSSQLAAVAILPTHTPGLAVYLDRTKISCPHEELGLEWNSVDYVLDRWGQGQSALSCSQQALASAVFPASCAIL